MDVDPNWWQKLFDEVYLLTDARSVCDEDITRREVDLICNLVPLVKEDRVLDLCGGHGRHSLALWDRGFKNCTVLDFSRHLVERGIKEARERGSKLEFIQADARKTGFSAASFDLVIIMGNSLGYLPEKDDDSLILAESFRLLCPGGWFLVDVADGKAIRTGFNPNAWHEIGDDILVCRQRQLKDEALCAREVVLSRKKGLIREQTYSIRIFEPDDLASLISQAGFDSVSIHRDFTPHRKEGDFGFMNKRFVVTARKPGRRKK